MPHSSANAPVVVPGPRMNVGGLMSSGTLRYTERILGEVYMNRAWTDDAVFDSRFVT